MHASISSQPLSVIQIINAIWHEPYPKGIARMRAEINRLGLSLDEQINLCKRIARDRLHELYSRAPIAVRAPYTLSERIAAVFSRVRQHFVTRDELTELFYIFLDRDMPASGSDLNARERALALFYNIVRAYKSQQTEEYNALLFQAIELKLQVCCEFLLNKGADANAKNSQGLSALHVAAVNSRDICELLINLGVGLEEAGPQGKTPIYMAVSAGLLPTVQLLFNRGALLDPLHLGETILHVAAWANSDRVLDWLCEKRAIDLKAEIEVVNTDFCNDPMVLTPFDCALLAGLGTRSSAGAYNMSAYNCLTRKPGVVHAITDLNPQYRQRLVEAVRGGFIRDARHLKAIPAFSGILGHIVVRPSLGIQAAMAHTRNIEGSAFEVSAPHE
ncbi:MAG: ankyrin repeat protein [Gammaproteobacteria bacterium]|jgi:hypothetical protein|nr:ankyrin repeat protein [Gammaproteobacteria bacterium]